MGAKLEVCAIEMLIKVHQYLINSYITTISLTLKSTLVTTEMKATSNAQTRNNPLCTIEVSHENTNRSSEAHRKYCKNPKHPLATGRLPIRGRIGRIAVRVARCS